MDPLATTEQLALHLGRPLDDDDPAATQALILASGAVRAYCHWDLSYVEDAALEVYGDGSAVLNLPTLCLLDVTAITVDGTDLGPIVRSADLWWSRKGQIHRSAGWCKDSVVNVVVNHGYQPIPDYITLVTLDAASRQLTNPDNLVAARDGEVQRTRNSAPEATGTLTSLHRALLDNYRLFT